MSKLQPIRFENARPMLLGGVRLHHTFEDCERSIARQWRHFQSLHYLPGQVGATAYGVICGHNAQGFEYLCGVEVDSFEQLPRDFGRVRIPAQYYAVFWHGGHISTIRHTWARILHEWLPVNRHESAETPDFEVYGHQFDPRTGLGGVEIWVGVTDKNLQEN